MNNLSTIKKNLGILFISQILLYLLSFIFTIYVARYLGTDGYGILSFAIAFTGMFSILSDLGLNTLMFREISREKEQTRNFFGQVILIKLILVIIAFLAIIVTINFLNYPQQTINIVYLFGIVITINAFNQSFYSLFQAYEKMEYSATSQILNNILLVIGAFYSIFHGLGLIEFALVYVAANLVTMFYNIFVGFRNFPLPKLDLDWDYLKQILKEAWPLGGMAMFIMIYFRIDVIMLSLIAGESSVGLYSAAYKISEATIIIPSVFMTAIFPLMSRYYKDSIESFENTYTKAIKYMFYSGILVAFIITILASPIISLIFGSEFSGSVISLQIIIWSSAIMYMTIIQGNTLITANKQMFSFKVTIIAAIFNIIINLILISKYSYIGASLSTVLTELFGFLIGIYFLNKWGYKLNIKRIFLPPILALLIVAIISIFLITHHISSIFTVLITTLLYLAIIYKLGIDAEDKLIIRNLLNGG